MVRKRERAEEGWDVSGSEQKGNIVEVYLQPSFFRPFGRAELTEA